MSSGTASQLQAVQAALSECTSVVKSVEQLHKHLQGVSKDANSAISLQPEQLAQQIQQNKSVT